MKRILAATILVIALAPAAQAHPLSFLGRTLKNMFTCARLGACIEQWAVVGAVAFDAITTTHRIDRCPRCTEIFPLMGSRPSKRTVAIMVPLWGVGMASVTQALHEHARSGSDRGFAHLFPIVAVGAHLGAGASNITCQPASRELVCR